MSRTSPRELPTIDRWSPPDSPRLAMRPGHRPFGPWTSSSLVAWPTSAFHAGRVAGGGLACPPLAATPLGSGQATAGRPGTHSNRAGPKLASTRSSGRCRSPPQCGRLFAACPVRGRPERRSTAMRPCPGDPRRATRERSTVPTEDQELRSTPTVRRQGPDREKHSKPTVPLSRYFPPALGLPAVAGGSCWRQELLRPERRTSRLLAQDPPGSRRSTSDHSLWSGRAAPPPGARSPRPRARRYPVRPPTSAVRRARRPG